MSRNVNVIGTTVEVLGKMYQVKCPEEEVAALQKAALELENKMKAIRAGNHILSVDRMAVIAALDMAHQLMALQQKVNERLDRLQQKIALFVS